jgi:hypothetical protein
MYVKSNMLKLQLLSSMLLCIAALVLLAGCQNATAQARSVPALKAAPDPWNSFMYGFNVNSSNDGIVFNHDANNAKRETLTQYVLYNPQYDGVSPNGKDFIYHQSMDGQMQYFTVLSTRPKTGYFYQQAVADAGNALWVNDNQNALVLNKGKGVSVVDVHTGLSHQIISLPYSANGIAVQRIERLIAYQGGFVYFIGAEGVCKNALCRVALTTDHPQYNASLITDAEPYTHTYWFSPDGKTVYYRNTNIRINYGTGIYAVNSDGTHRQLLRATEELGGVINSQPVGFDADGALLIVRYTNGNFQLTRLGNTPQQDSVLVKNVAPGIALPSCSDASTDLCSENLLLSPSAQALIVQGKLSNGNDQLWETSIPSGAQHVVSNLGNKQGDAVQLIGWDQLLVCAGNRC